ncbi:MAG: hypothetical protein ACM34C_00535, partial [Syntrophaceae bacterium]
MPKRIKPEPIKMQPPLPGVVPPCSVAPDSLIGIPRVQTNPCRWHGEGWTAFASDLAGRGIVLDERRALRAQYLTDAGGIAHGNPHGVLVARTTG